MNFLLVVIGEISQSRFAGSWPLFDKLRVTWEGVILSLSKDKNRKKFTLLENIDFITGNIRENFKFINYSG